MRAHWSVYKDSFADWRFQLVDEDGSIILEGEPKQDRQQCIDLLHKVQGLAAQKLDIDIEPYPAHLRAGDVLDDEITEKRSLFDV